MSFPEYLNTTKNIQEFLNKKEFAQLKLSKLPKDENVIFSKNPLSKINELTLDSDILSENLLVLHSHQQFTRNMMNPNTPYNRLLLKHATGTGKTIASLSIAMLFIKYYQLQYSLTEETSYSQTPLVY